MLYFRIRIRVGEVWNCVTSPAACQVVPLVNSPLSSSTTPACPSRPPCPAGTSLAGGVAMVARYRIHALIVSDPAGLAMGVLSDFDILAGEWLAAGEGSQAAMRRVTVRELMSPHVPTVDVDQTAAETAERIRPQHNYPPAV